MRAHDDMGKPDVNVTYKVGNRAADANDMTVDVTLAVITKTAAKDRDDHSAEYGSATRPTPAPTGG